MPTTDNWPIVTRDDPGIRGVTGPALCHYCRSLIGEPHGPDCVIVTKRVRLRYTYEIEIDVPHDWDTYMIEFHRNDGSWCANNSIDELEAAKAGDDCLCSRFKAEFIEVVDETPRVKGD